MWQEQWGDISPYNLVGVEQYLEEMHHVLNDTSLKRKCHHFLPFLFKVYKYYHPILFIYLLNRLIIIFIVCHVFLGGGQRR